MTKKQESIQLNESIINSVIFGDCLDILKTIPSDSVDACITDPPYNISGINKKEIGWYKSNSYWKDKKSFSKIDEQWDKFTEDDYIQFSFAWMSEIKRIVKPNGNIAIFGSFHNIYKVGYLFENLDLRIVNSIVWYKRNAFPNITQRMFCESTEHIIWGANNSKKKAKNWTFNYADMKEMNGGKQMRNMFDIPNTKQSERKEGKHPSQKPLEVMDRLITALTNKGDVVIDPFLGSGSTAVAALNKSRKFIGIEREKEFVDLANRRILNR